MSGFISGISALFVPSVYMFVSRPVPHCLGYYSFVVNFEIRRCESSNFVLPQDFSRLLRVRSLRFHENSRMDFSVSAKKNVVGILLLFFFSILCFM